RVPFPNRDKGRGTPTVAPAPCPRRSAGLDVPAVSVEVLHMHRGYLGISQNAYLVGMTAGERHAAAEKGLDLLIPADRMFYIAAFQSGVERFICHFVHEGARHLPFLEKRISTPKHGTDAA